MATAAAPSVEGTVLERVHRLSVEDVHRMAEAGILDETQRVELVQGVLVDMVPIGGEHDAAVARLTRHFGRVDSEVWELRVQSTLLVEGGYLLPDVMLVDPRLGDEQPRTAMLVVEVAQTSQARDRAKAADYARADIGEYWIVDLAERTLTVHRRALAGAYADVVTLRDGQAAEPLAPQARAVEVSALLG